ncbi:hypothetical protein U9M48_007040 [Paspalum notatum var. saurae]|uniref:Ent-kaurenoic acid oxidase n=1 Tax=Paspalum notatum var. saurae TaxID=547442 RepID=A0AAQ3Q154_PASNO
MAAATNWAWWIGLLLGAVPLLALAVWHCNDAGHRAAFALKRWRRRARLPPGHMGLPFVGESLALLWYFKFARHPDGFVHAKRRRYAGDDDAGLYRTHIFGSPTVLVCSPAANKFVLHSSQDTFGVSWPAPELVGVSSVVNVEGSQHARLRGFILSAISHPRSLRTIAEVIQPRIMAALRSWADKGTVTAATEIKKCRKKLDATFIEELKRRRNKELDAHNDLMSGLMQMEDSQGKKLNDDEVVHNIVSLVFAGYESTSNAIMWAVYHLAKSPNALRKLREENVAVSRDKNGGFITLDDIPSMKYTAKVVEETIRVANIATSAYRYTIPKGWRVVVWLRSLHTDANYYGDPLSFNPDRWDNPPKPGTYQVFGGGPRICAGNMLAKLQLTIMLHHLAVGYKWELLNPNAEVTYSPHAKPVDGVVPLLALAVWHCNDASHCAAFALKRWRRRARLPPGHMGLPFVGESLALLWYFKFARRPDGFVHAKRRRYAGEGDAGLYRTHLFGSPTVLVCSPAANKFVLQSSQDGTFGVSWPAPELVGVSSVINVEGSQHARLRGFILAAINHPSSLRTIAEVIQPRIMAALRSWADKGSVTAATEIKKVMFDNICKTFVSMDPSPLTDTIARWFAGLIAGFRAFPLDFPGTAFRHARACRKKLDAAFMEELQRRKKGLDVHNDLMSGLMQMTDDQGKKLNDDEVVHNIVTLVFAGFESTSNNIMWAVYHLAKSPHALHKLREENMAVSRTRNGGFITLDDIPSMKYTAKVRYTIPKGWRVVVWLRSLHTDANYYDDPLSFNPDRWDNPPKPGTYQVFGGGPRICAGNMLARLQLTIMLHHLAVGYKWELLNPNAEVTYSPHAKPVDGALISFSKLNSD